MTAFRCLGPRTQELSTVLERMESYGPADCWTPPAKLSAAEAEQLPKAIMQVVVLSQTALDDPDTDDVLSALFRIDQKRSASLVNKFSREGCGEDLGPLIEGLPRDGELHERECPGCGRDVRVRRSEAA